jgi:hypothetical protein
LSEGTHLITAEYGGSTTHIESTSAIVSLAVVRHATSVALTATPNPVTNGSSVTFQATVSSENGTPTGNVVFKEGANVLATVALSGGVATFSTDELNLGVHGITAEYEGEVAYAPSTSALLSIGVVRLATTTTLTANPAVAAYGDAVTLEATVAGTGTPTGQVSFWDGAVKLGEANLVAGKATLVVDDLDADVHSLTAMYEGSSIHIESTSTAINLTITQATTTISLESSVSDSAFAQTIYLTATVEVNEAMLRAAGLSATTPTGFVTFKDGNETIGVAPLEDGKAYLSIQTLRPGSHNITAIYGANGNFTPSTSNVTIQTVTLAQLGVAIEVNPNPAFSNQVVVLKAIVLAPEGNPTGTITFMENGVVLGVVVLVGDTATLNLSNLTVGRHDLVAFYNGDGGFAAQGSEPLIVNVIAFKPPLRLPIIMK